MDDEKVVRFIRNVYKKVDACMYYRQLSESKGWGTDL